MFAGLDLRKTVIYEFWYDYKKSKSSENVKLFYMDTDGLIVHVMKQTDLQEKTKIDRPTRKK